MSDDLVTPLNSMDLSGDDIAAPAGFEVSLNLLQFASEEISVKIVNDSCIVVEAKHEGYEDEAKHEGYEDEAQHFLQRYDLPEPEALELEQIQCTISTDGILNVTVPEKVLPREPVVHNITINLTNQPFVQPPRNTSNDEIKLPHYSSAA